MQIKVMTYNIHHGRGTDKQFNLERIAAVVEEHEAELVGLNEVDRHFSKRSEFLDQAAWLANRLNMHHAFGAALTVRARGSGRLRQYGNAFLSRHPITAYKNHPFPFDFRLTEGRALLEIEVQTPERTLKIYVTHLSLNPFLHKKQTDFIVNKLANELQPVILLGDWNMRPRSAAWKKIGRQLTDVCQAAGEGPCLTYPAKRPRSQLDYIFVSRHFQVLSVTVPGKHAGASDHLPLLATLRLNGKASFS
ncbi:endonuclease/exonuclease/phosphatase family protein [Effusibacillus pohliae]|uniref:endonuclease/exonuclease/phosphatase family protein n=1 Tax=Effusibacillus pohliae TaxID=232270 RepID=UPI000382F2E0|nr:endonuclease/exonuclease/phosphatase family protein [Effusibacillus pohliae]